MAEQFEEAQETTQGVTMTESPKAGAVGGLLDEDLEKLTQRIEDRVRRRYSDENKKLQEQFDKLKKAKLTEDEQKALDLEEKEQQILQRERELRQGEARLLAIKAIKAAGLDDGSERALELVDFVLAEDPGEMEQKVGALKALIEQMVSARVEETFRRNGRTPEKGIPGGGGENPYAKEQWNLTKQMELEAKNPELAAQLQALGVSQ